MNVQEVRKSILLSILVDLSIPYFGFMTPCTLRRLSYLLRQTTLSDYFKDVVYSHENADIHSVEIDLIINKLIADGYAIRGTHTDLKATKAGIDRCTDLRDHEGVTADYRYQRAIKYLGRLTNRLEGPYGSRLLAVARAHADEEKNKRLLCVTPKVDIDQLIKLCASDPKEDPTIPETIWVDIADRTLSEFA